MATCQLRDGRQLTAGRSPARYVDLTEEFDGSSSLGCAAAAPEG